MAFSVTSMSGIRRIGETNSKTVWWVPGDPGIAYTKGNLCTMSNGVLVAVTDSAEGGWLRPTRTVTASAAGASTPFTRPEALKPHGDPADELTLIPCEVDLPDGVPINLAKVHNITDDTVASYSAASRYVACTTGFGADARPNGSIAYVYEGPGMGEFNIVEDYDHTGGAVELMLVFHRAFKATLTSSSKIIVFGSTAAANAMSFFGRCDAYDADEIDCIDGYDDGNYITVPNWLTLPDYVAKGWMPYISYSALHA